MSCFLNFSFRVMWFQRTRFLIVVGNYPLFCFYHSLKCSTICEGYGNDVVDFWRIYVFGIGLASCLFCLFVVVIAIGDRVKLLDNNNKELVIGKLKIQSISLFLIISLMCFSFWIVMMVMATLKARMSSCEVLFT